MNRILFERSEVVRSCVTFGGVRAHHVLCVLHGCAGQTLKTGIVDGLIGEGVIECIEGTPATPGEDPESASLRITVRCRHDTPALAPWVDVILAVPRPRVLKRLLPQLAALGVARIFLVGGEKTEKQYWGAQILKENVYRPFLIEGLMQAGTTALPTIAQVRHVTHWLDRGDFESVFATASTRIVAHPYETAANSPTRRAEALPHAPSTLARPLVAIGPEGGWTDAEVACFEAHHFARVSLGARILRTDTACVALLARLMPTPK